MSPALMTDVSTTIDRGVEALIGMQDGDGWWKGVLDTNVTMDAEDLLLRQFLGVLEPELASRTAAWIRSKQGEDGSWATFHGGPGDVSTTVEAYVALRLAGDPADAHHLAAAAAFVQRNGGVEATRVFTRFWLALFGLWSWDDLPAMPPEVVLLPRWAPLNIYDFACWARQTIVPLTVVAAHRPQRQLPFGIDELRTGRRPVRARPATFAGRALLRLDRVLHSYERRPIKKLRARAMRRAGQWVAARQEADGSWGGIQPPWVYSMMALHLLGWSLDHPVMVRAFAGLDAFSVHEGETRRLEACQSPVWDTALAVVALRDCGVERSHPALRAATGWLLAEEVRIRGDWAVRRRQLAPGGWAFEFANDNYPDIDDTAEVVLALRKAATSDVRSSAVAAVERARRWVLGMQCKDGGWAAFDVDNTSQLPRLLPFCDFGEVIDPPSADVTAHVVEMLAELGTDAPAMVRGIEWLWRAQEDDGSWFGRWGANHVYGTGHVVPALVAAGVDVDDPRLSRARQWLLAHQQDDGGWGEDLRSYRDPAWVGRGASTASQTAWALIALLALGERDPAVDRGIGYLVRTQRPDGIWDEPWYTGTGFPGDFYINYHLYRQVFPLMALGRYQEVA
jgi:squalene-hopene/tetraprenyl-beta-curcumene cyclase